MIFNSIDFLIFFTVVFALYWTVFNKNVKVQNMFLLAVSYFFYAWWDWRFLLLLAGSSLMTFLIAENIARSSSEKIKRIFLTLGVVTSLSILAFFKYFNFFVGSFIKGMSVFNIAMSEFTLNIILPLGISFYTFRILSYLFDVRNEKIEPIKDWVQFFIYISFFPTLISGPIDRATTFAPQLQRLRVFTRVQGVEGLRQIMWGLFKKIVIADNCVHLIENIFNNYEAHSGSTLMLGAFLFAIQVYADFSGYSDIAIGVSSLLGFNVTRNFNNPYFAENITEFWRRWHMSLTKWFTDYLYSPLTIALRDLGKLGLVLAIIINMCACGIWHGASWNFVVFGLINGFYFIPFILTGSIYQRKKTLQTTRRSSIIRLRNILLTFLIVMLTDVLFRSESVIDAIGYYQGILSPSLLSIPKGILKPEMLITLFFILVMFTVEWAQQHKAYVLDISDVKSPVLRFGIYYTLAIIIFIFGSFSTNEFIYLQF